MLKFLLIILCVFLLLRMFTRNMVASSFADMQQKMRDEMGRRNKASNPQKPEGHVSISGDSRPSATEKGGEYVDYEEIK